MAHPKDKLKYEFNIFTGEFDLVTDFNTGRIVTSEYIHTGSIRVTWDMASSQFISDNPVVVIDSDGNVIKV